MKELTLKEVADWLAETGASLHVRADGNTFVVVAHLARETRAADCTTKDLEHGVKVVMADF